MSTADIQDNLSSILFSKTRRAILSLLFTNPDRDFYVREILRSTGRGQGSAQRELIKLHAAGIIDRYERGNQVFYQADRSCPIFEEISSIILKTIGVAGVLRDALRQLSERIDVAFIYGSFARGEQVDSSDVDLLVVGNVSFSEIVSKLKIVEEKLRREINPTVCSVTEFRNKVSQDDHFIGTIIDGEQIYLMGDENELTRLEEK